MKNLYQQVSKMILDQIDVLARVSVDRQYALQPELWKPYNQIGYTKSLRDAGYHFSYLAESLSANDSSLFLNYIAWVKVLFVGLGFPIQALTTALACTEEALQETLPPELATLACTYIDAALEHIPNTPDTLE